MRSPAMVFILLAGCTIRADEFKLSDAIPSDAVKYEPAKFTQSIAVRDSARVIDAMPRYFLERKWQVPGGLDAISGWKSDLYKILPSPVKQWQELMPTVNGFGGIQMEVGYVRNYPDGTEFYDVLSNSRTGKPFEIRLREKRDGVWAFRVPFRDEAQYPIGYRPVSGCVSCHSQTGTGNYGGGLVPGGDQTISDPLFDDGKINRVRIYESGTYRPLKYEPVLSRP